MTSSYDGQIVKNSVLLLKDKDKESDADPYETGFQKHGLTAIFLPVLEFAFINIDELTDALLHPDNYSSLVLTSQRAVEAVSRSETDVYLWKRKRVFVVGTSTAEAAKKLGFSVAGSETGNADSLIHIVLQSVKDSSKPVLFPCGNLRRESLPEGLRKAGVPVREIVVYETSNKKDITENIARMQHDQGIPEFVCFFSPSGVKFSRNAFMNTDLVSSLKMISMGRSTSRTLRDEGMCVHAEAREPSSDGVINAVISNRNDAS